MNKPKRKRQAKVETEFDQAFAHFLQTNKKELEDEIVRTKREAEEVEKYVEERRESIRRGARRSKHKFRL